MCKENKCKDCIYYFREAHNLCYEAEADLVEGDSKACYKFREDKREEDFYEV